MFVDFSMIFQVGDVSKKGRGAAKLQEQFSMNSDWGSVGSGRIGMPLLMCLFSPEVVCICLHSLFHGNFASGTNIKHGRRRVEAMRNVI